MNGVINGKNYNASALESKSFLRPTYVGPTVDRRGLSGLQSWAAEPTYVGRKILLGRNINRRL